MPSMNWAKKRKLISGYDRERCIYDAKYSEEQRSKISTALGGVKINHEDLILDVGCGTGILFDYLAHSSRLIVGLDFSKGLLSQAKKRAGTLQNAELILADADYLPLKSDFFDEVFAFTLLQNSPVPSETLRQMIMTCKRGGYIVVTGLKKSFTQEGFKNLLRESHLDIKGLIEETRDCVAVCQKLE